MKIFRLTRMWEIVNTYSFSVKRKKERKKTPEYESFQLQQS